jgi:hypothetical protein
VGRKIDGEREEALMHEGGNTVLLREIVGLPIVIGGGTTETQNRRSKRDGDSVVVWVFNVRRGGPCWYPLLLGVGLGSLKAQGGAAVHARCQLHPECPYLHLC